MNTCPVCDGPLCDHGHCAKEVEPCTRCETDCFRICPVCTGLVCQHGVCINNWCEHDDECAECLDQRNLEQDAEDNARYYSGEKPE